MINPLNKLIDTKQYNKNVRESKKIQKSIQPKKITRISEDPFLPDEKSFNIFTGNHGDEESADLLRIMSDMHRTVQTREYEGVRTVYDTDVTDDKPKLAERPVFHENNIGDEAFKRLMTFELTEDNIFYMTKSGEKKQIFGDGQVPNVPMAGFNKLDKQGKPKLDKKTGEPVENYKCKMVIKAIRRLLSQNRIPGECCLCGDSTIAPQIRFKTSLEEVFFTLRAIGIDKFPLLAFINPQNIVQLCETDDCMRRHIKSKSTKNVPREYGEKRREFWRNRYDHNRSLSNIEGGARYSKESTYGVEAIMHPTFAKSELKKPNYKDIQELTK